MTFQVLNAVVILFLVSLGLSVVLGLMGVINMAHPGIMAIGAYGAVAAHDAGLAIPLAMLAGVLAAAMAGVALEPLIRRLYARPLDTILATWAVSLIVTQVLALGFGRAARSLDPPVSGFTSIGGADYSTYRIVVIVSTCLLGLTLHVLLRYTTGGLMVRATMSNFDLAQGAGINTRRVQRSTFVLGAGLAGTAGVLIAPLTPVEPYFGVNYLVPAFLVVLLAGRSMGALLTGAIILASTQTIMAHRVDAVVGSICLVCVAVIALRIAPAGLSMAALPLLGRRMRSA